MGFNSLPTIDVMPPQNLAKKFLPFRIAFALRECLLLKFCLHRQLTEVLCIFWAANHVRALAVTLLLTAP